MHESRTFKFWGLGVRQTKYRIIIDQNLYVFIYIPNRHKIETVLEKKWWTELREKDKIKKTDRSDDVDIHSDMTWCCIWCVSDE